VHGVEAPPSREQVKVDASSAANKKVAEVAVIVPDGPPVMVVSGARVSTVNLRTAGDGSTLPAASMA
jgi:hypothetical protein